jgi:hypothetical protein
VNIASLTEFERRHKCFTDHERAPVKTFIEETSMSSQGRKVENERVLISIWPDDGGWLGKVHRLPGGQVFEFGADTEEAAKAEAERYAGESDLLWETVERD